jgi:hypothetical protein
MYDHQKMLEQVKIQTNADRSHFGFIEELLLSYIGQDRERLDKLEAENKELRELLTALKENV